MFTHFQVNWALFHEQVQISAEKLFSIFCRVSKKNAAFWPNIGQKSAKFSKFLKINKTHINTSYVRIVGHLVNFWAKNGHFRLFFGPILAYIIIQGNAGRVLYTILQPRSGEIQNAQDFQNRFSGSKVMADTARGGITHGQHFPI